MAEALRQRAMENKPLISLQKMDPLDARDTVILVSQLLPWLSANSLRRRVAWSAPIIQRVLFEDCGLAGLLSRSNFRPPTDHMGARGETRRSTGRATIRLSRS